MMQQFGRRRLGNRPFQVVRSAAATAGTSHTGDAGMPSMPSMLSMASHQNPEALLAQFRAKAGASVSADPTLAGGHTLRGASGPPPQGHPQQHSAASGAALLEQLKALQAKVDMFDKYHVELSHIVYTYLGTAMCDVPYYEKLPQTKQQLAAPSGVIPAGTVVTLGYPHTTTDHFGWMRHRRVHPNLANVNTYFVPLLSNGKLTQQDLQQMGLDPSLGQYFDFFHHAGEANPADEAYDN